MVRSRLYPQHRRRRVYLCLPSSSKGVAYVRLHLHKEWGQIFGNRQSAIGVTGHSRDRAPISKTPGVLRETVIIRHRSVRKRAMGRVEYLPCRGQHNGKSISTCLASRPLFHEPLCVQQHQSLPGHHLLIPGQEQEAERDGGR